MTSSEVTLVWAAPTAIAFHYLEEVIWLPAWSVRGTGRWYRPVSILEVRFASTVLTALVVVIGALTQLKGFGSVWHYLLASIALGQGINILIPHASATIATRTYAPGLGTGLAFVLPAAAAVLFTGFSRHQLQSGRFLLTAVIFIPAVLVSVRLSLWAAKRLELRRAS